MKIKVLSLLAIAFLLLACALPIVGGQEPAAQATDRPAVEEEPSPTPGVDAAETPATGGPSSGLNHTGPWWFLAGVDGAWAVNADGSGLTRVIHEPAVNISNLAWMAAPTGGHVAYIMYQDPQAYQGLTLKLLSLPSGEIETITALTPPGPDALPGDPMYEAQRAITETTSLAWSMDGQSLVFTGAMDGSAADLYLYKLTDGSITRLTHNTAHAVHPFWAPDSSLIAFITVTTLGTGAGYSMEALWVVDAYTGVVQQVPYAPENGFVEVIGWIAPDTLLVDTWNALCGSSHLSAVRVLDGAATLMWEGCFDSFNFSFDPNSGTALSVVDRNLAAFNPDPRSGLLWMDAKSGQNQWLNENESYRVGFLLQPGLFTAANAIESLFLSPDGSTLQTLNLPAAMPGEMGQPQPIFSWDGNTWAMSAPSSTLWVGDRSGALFTIPFETVEWMSFVPGQDVLLLKTTNGFYRAAAPDFTPLMITENGEVSPLDLNNNVMDQCWVMP